MGEQRNNLRTIIVLTAACLACVYCGYLMGVSVGVPRPVPKAKTEDSNHVIRVAGMVDAADFEAVADDLMSQPEVKHTSLQGTPLKMVKIKLLKIVKTGLTKHDAGQIEKYMYSMDEAVFSDFSDVPADQTARFKHELLPLLDYMNDDDVSDPDLNCIFGLTENGGKTISSLVMVLSHSNLQIVRFIGESNPTILDLLTGFSEEN